jgi:hypothetical protein
VSPIDGDARRVAPEVRDVRAGEIRLRADREARAFLDRGFAPGACHFDDEARETLRKLGGVPEGAGILPAWQDGFLTLS